MVLIEPNPTSNAPDDEEEYLVIRVSPKRQDRPATNKQKSFLFKHRIKIEPNLTRGEAYKLIHDIIKKNR